MSFPPASVTRRANGSSELNQAYAPGLAMVTEPSCFFFPLSSKHILEFTLLVGPFLRFHCNEEDRFVISHSQEREEEEEEAISGGKTPRGKKKEGAMPEWGGEHLAVGRRAHLSSSSAAVSMNPDDDKENIPPWRIRLSARLKRTPRRKSPLPSWYPRTPLRDITAIVQAIEKRRARQRELERIRMEQSTDSPPLEDVSAAEITDSPKPEDVPVMPQSGDPTLHSLATPESSDEDATTFLESLDRVAVKKDNSASPVAPLGSTTPVVIPDTVTNIDSCTPASAVPVVNLASSIPSCDQTPVSEVIAEKWWLKPRADTSNAGGAGAEIKKKGVLQQRSRVCLMR